MSLMGNMQSSFFLVAMAADTVSRMRRTATSGCSVSAPAPVPSFMGTVAMFGFISFIHSHSPRSPHTQYTGTPRELAMRELSISSGASMPFTLTKLFWVFMVWESGLPGICAALWYPVKTTPSNVSSRPNIMEYGWRAQPRYTRVYSGSFAGLMLRALSCASLTTISSTPASCAPSQAAATSRVIWLAK